MKTFIRHIYVQRSLLTYVRSPAGTTAENIFIWWPPDNMWWPPDRLRCFIHRLIAPMHQICITLMQV